MFKRLLPISVWYLAKLHKALNIYIYIYIYNALQPDLCRVLYSVTQFDNTYIYRSWRMPGYWYIGLFLFEGGTEYVLFEEFNLTDRLLRLTTTTTPQWRVETPHHRYIQYCRHREGSRAITLVCTVHTSMHVYTLQGYLCIYLTSITVYLYPPPTYRRRSYRLGQAASKSYIPTLHTYLGMSRVLYSSTGVL